MHKSFSNQFLGTSELVLRACKCKIRSESSFSLTESGNTEESFFFTSLKVTPEGAPNFLLKSVSDFKDYHSCHYEVLW